METADSRGMLGVRA